jgi:hypothetical protein
MIKIFEHSRVFCFFRFRGQTQLFMGRPCELQMAIEEAVLAENGFIYTAGKTTNSQANPPEIQHQASSC